MDLFLYGLTLGMANALLAVGLVLVYMSSRIITFAHAELGAFAVAMMVMLVRVYHCPYLVGLLGSLLATGLLGAIIERTIIQRLFDAPRLIALIATIGIAQLVIVARLILPKEKVAGRSKFVGGGDAFPVPFRSFSFDFGRIRFGTAHVMVLTVGPLVALAVVWFLRSSVYGLSIRAAAENAPRARLLGIPVRNVSTLAWVLSALLSGVAAILLAPITGFSPGEAVGLPLLLRGLAAATLVGFESVSGAFAAGLFFGVLDQLVFFYTNKSGLSDAIIFAVVLVALMARRQRGKRTTAAEESSFRVADPERPLPREVARHPRWRAVSWSGSALAALSLLSAPRWLSGGDTLLLATVCAISVVVVSLTLLSGWSGQVSIGHWAIAGSGGILGSRLMGSYGMPFWWAFACAGAIGAVIALLLGLPALRLPGTLLAVVTLGLAVVSNSWLFGQDWFRGPGRLVRPVWITGDTYLYLCIGVLAVVLVAVSTLQRSRFGRNLYAVRDNPVQAAAMGVSVVRTRLSGFVVSGTIAAFGGFLWSAGVITTTTESFPAIRSLAILSAAIIGGLGSIGGAVLGTAYLIGVPFLLSGVSPYIGILSSGIGLLILVLFFPRGLAGIAASGRNLLAGWVTGLEPRPRVMPNEEQPSLPSLPSESPTGRAGTTSASSTPPVLVAS